MFVYRWLVFAALSVACLFPISMSRAQEDLFGAGETPGAPGDPFGPVGDSTADAAPVDPSAAAVEALAKEKSILAPAPKAEAEAGSADFCRCVGESDSEAVARIEKALESPISSNGLEFADTPLEEVVNLLQAEHEIPIQIDVKALEETGIDPTVPVNVSLRNISLRSALQLLLRTLQLTYVVRDEVLMITTPEEAESQLRTCVYSVRHFVHDTSKKSMDDLIDTIVSCIATESWAENGGGEAEIRVPRRGCSLSRRRRKSMKKLTAC